MTSAAFQEASDVHDGLRRRLKDLQEYSIPNLRDCKGPLSFQQQLATDVREDIDVFARELQKLDTLVGDQYTEKDRQKVLDWVEEMTVMIQQIRKDSRAALLQSKRNIDAQNKSYREELLTSNAVASGSKEKEPLHGDDALMKATNDVTEAFRRTTGLMQQELERSVLTQQMFDESSRTLSATSDLYSSFGSLLTTSKALVTALERSDLLDRILIISSLILFLSVVAYILKKRLVDKGVTLAFWWVKYLPQRQPQLEPVVRLPAPEAAPAMTVNALPPPYMEMPAPIPEVWPEVVPEALAFIAAPDREVL